MRLSCGCSIIPSAVLKRFARDPKLSDALRKAFADTRKAEDAWRSARVAQTAVIQTRELVSAEALPIASSPTVSVFDCKNTTSLPGVPIAGRGSSRDLTAKRAYNQTKRVARFYKSCFGRNSIDDAGMTLLSSIHYGRKYNNAFWNGSQMTYGDGDGQIFLDFTTSNDVIGHELTHGVTQHTAGLLYVDEPGALNESISDVFGSMFRQWENKQSVAKADWLIGADIMGAAAKARGYTCLRDMADPGAAHCLSRQPSHYSNYIPHGDPHDNSGIPNQAFYLVATRLGGKSWEKAGRVWYTALVDSKATGSMGFKAFASLTRAAAKALFPKDGAVGDAVQSGWAAVGI